RGLSTVLVTHDIPEAVFLGQWILVLPGEPGREPALIRNPGAGDPAYRAQPE
ncbi:MAG: ABC transporter ATP-binding protein, partial [Chloroflexi bacterium]|nr:ABC transporter ATP-binding protein [Chloroflexota bacterium]